jgi:opacity protein-like surface antigen
MPERRRVTPLSRRRLLVAPTTLALALFGSSVPAGAGERLPPDLFAGYSFAQVSDVSRHGANLASSFALLGPVSGFVDASVHWGSKDSVDRSDLTLMAGPGVRLGRAGGTVFFVRALAGLVRDRASVAVLDVDISESDSRFGVLAGGGVDIPFAARWAVRVQGDYLWNDVSAVDGVDGVDVTKSGFRASAGVVYRFGARP